MNHSSCSQHQLGNDSRRNGNGDDSGAQAASIAIEALAARLSLVEGEVVQALRLLNNTLAANNSVAGAIRNHEGSSGDDINHLCSTSAHSTLTKASCASRLAPISSSGTYTLCLATKGINSSPGPRLNPASCASGLALLGGGSIDGDESGDWISNLSLIDLLERRNVVSNHQQGNGSNHMRTASNENEDWDEILPTQENPFL